MTSLKAESSVPKVVTKNSVRKQVYAEFDRTGLQKVWHHIGYHIPTFPTIQDAITNLDEISEYQNAATVVTKTGNVLKGVRLKALKDQKKLLVPIPFPSDIGSFYLLEAPENANEKSLQEYVTRFGLHEKGKVVVADSSYSADIIILGSVAVDKQGRRIGSGKDYCDLELAVMAHKGMITQETVIATIVDDIQVMESLPEELFGEHDFGVGLIITPSQTIRVSPPPARPPGILWKLLTQAMLQVVPILGELHQVESKADSSLCELKEEKVEESVRSRPRRRIFRRQPPLEKGEDKPNRPIRKVRQRKAKTEIQREHGSDPDQSEAKERPPRENGNGARKPYERRRRYQIDFSLCVRNLAPDVRVRDLKNALTECHVKPAEIKWRGPEGYAVLHFARGSKESKETPTPTSIDGMINCLRNLNVSATQQDGLLVEPYNRVTRIEVTDQVTAV